MKLFIDTFAIRLMGGDQEERDTFKSEAENIGLTVVTNNKGELEAFGEEAKLYILIFSLSLFYKLTII